METFDFLISDTGIITRHIIPFHTLLKEAELSQPKCNSDESLIKLYKKLNIHSN